MRRCYRQYSFLVALVALYGCGPNGPSDPTEQDLDPAASLIAPFDASHHAGHGRGCRAAEHRQLDFWLGKWDVLDVEGKPAGTNTVEREVGGCAIEENFTGPDGGRGRSLSVYDRTTRRWHHMFVGSSATFGSVLMLDGRVERRTMVMDGRREYPGFPVYDRITWTPRNHGEMHFLYQFQFPGTELLTGFDARYVRNPAITPAPEQQVGPSCQDRAANRQFDFALGTWAIHPSGAATRRRPIGTVTIASDLSGCLVTEELSGPAGYQAIAYGTWFDATGLWTRTYVDDRGNRLLLVGGLDGEGRLVLTQGGLRAIWQPAEGGRMIQRWERSRDGGVTWRPLLELTLVRQ